MLKSSLLRNRSPSDNRLLNSSVVDLVFGVKFLSFIEPVKGERENNCALQYASLYILSTSSLYILFTENNFVNVYLSYEQEYVKFNAPH